MPNLPALILAAGRGERLKPLTDHTPKPLIHVRGKPLIEWHLEALARDGVREVVINTAWLEERFPAALGDGSRWGLRIRYSMEGRDHGGALETAGGMAKALPLLGEAFWSVSGDVFVPGFRFDQAAARRFQEGEDWGHLWLVPNPPHVPLGDFAIDDKGRVLPKHLEALRPWTYGNIALYRPAMVDHLAPGTKAALRPSMDRAIEHGRLSAETWPGPWTDVGTPERLASLNDQPTGVPGA
ncbi:nucleotidyltransferase family protein [Aquabacterium soli]|uniref:Nucleotidyltransferase family protein n=1 Tax=Aquabacterium soli TaxID=2493092 RepID=A0A426VCL2_9BURK|nr:nucleotidyltransferase family protein [Aquabacterium soli]RRS04595.1 nucleotidyltransferase family protein [Aquabacterium soli]